MYEDYQRQQNLYENGGVELFPTPIIPYRQSRILELQKKKKKKKSKGKKQTNQRRARQTRSDNKLKEQLHQLIKTSDSSHKGTQGILKNMESLLVPVLLIGATLVGLSQYLNSLNIKDLEQNAYGGDVSPSGRSTGKLSEKGKHFIANEEGLKTTAYKDSKGKLTIGIGHTGLVDGKPIYEGMTITKEKAMQLFEQDVVKFENYVNSVVKVPVTQNMFDAMVSYSFNVGSLGPKFLQKLNSGDYKGAMAELTTINKELVGRRSREQKLFGSDIGADGKLMATAINPKVDVSTTTKTLKDIGKVKEINGNGIRYDESANITSHTKLAEGTNPYYDASKGDMGTFNGVKITSGIGRRSVERGSSWHRGLDLAYAKGTPVKAFCSGKCTHAGVMSGFGRLVIINDKNGYRHLYGHLSRISVSLRQNVKKGQIIGYSGGSGTNNGVLVDNYYAPHLHYGIWQPGGTSDKKDYIDPRTYTYPPEAGEIPQTQPPKTEVPKTPPITPKTQQPTTKNPSTQKNLPKPVSQTQTNKPAQKPQQNIQISQNKQKQNNNLIPLDSPNIKNRSMKQTKKK